MRGINKVFLLGHVGQDPIVRHTANGRAVCELSIATHRSVRNGETWAEEVDWHRVRLWEQKAELALRYVTKGSPLAVEGFLRNEQWTDAQGQRRTRTVISAEQIHLLPGRPSGDRAQGEAAPRDEAPPRQPAAQPEAEDEIPF